MEWFDCNCHIGLGLEPSLRPVPTAHDLLVEMDRSGISRALVWHVASRECAVPVGNRLLADAIAPHRDRLIGAWGLLPSQTGEFPPPERLCEQMAEAGVRALRAWPADGRYLLRAEVLGPTLEMLCARRIPLILDVPGAVSWPDCYDLIAEFPSLICVLSDTGLWGPDRSFRPLIDRYEGVHVELTTYFLDGGIEAFCSSYGPRQMLFGTGFPAWDHGGMMLALRHAQIPDSDRAAIASGNLARLLKEADL